MELKDWKSAAVVEFSSYATVIHAGLEEWGGLPETSVVLRCTESSIQIVAARIVSNPKERGSRQVSGAVQKLLDETKKKGFKRAWYGLAFPDTELEENLASIGFNQRVEKVRLERDTPAKDIPLDPDFRLVPVAFEDSLEEVPAFFEASRPKDIFSDWQVDPTMVTRLFMHEMVTPHWMPAYFWIEYLGRRIGVIAIAESRNLEGEKTSVLTPLLESSAWNIEVLRRLLDYLGKVAANEGCQKIVLACESAGHMLEQYRSLGFSIWSQFLVLHKPLR